MAKTKPKPKSIREKYWRPVAKINRGIALLLMALAVGTGLYLVSRTHAATAWPTTPPAQICGTSQLDGPATAPAGAITVPAGDNSALTPNYANPGFSVAGSTFWFAPGVHTLGSTQYSQIVPGNNSTFIGAPGAIIDGQSLNNYAFTGKATGVTIKYLTIRNFTSPNDQGVVNHDYGHNWTFQYNTFTLNGGAAVFLGAGNTASYNCLKDNSQYGFQGFGESGASGLTLDHNEISGNNTGDWETRQPGCGCTGGGKFWDVRDVRITNNYVHDNHSVGLWADTNNADFVIDGNWIENNEGQAIFYEISYNAAIRNNVIKHNLTKNGAQRIAAHDNFPDAAIYISESGGDSRVGYSLVGSPTIDISNNLFEDNFNGVSLWENADRYCNSPNNTSSAYCTLVNPSVATLASCNATNIGHEPYYSDCRWKTQNVKVHDNTFSMNFANFTSCTATYCGHNAITSNYGTSPAWSPYRGTAVQQAITFNQGNSFTNNTYLGTWNFMPIDTGHLVSFATWQAAPYNQDGGSTLNGSTPAATLSPAPTPVPTSTPVPTATPVATATPTPTPTPAATPAPTPTATPASGGSTSYLKTFETGTENLVNWFNTTVAQSTATAHSGTHSLAVTENSQFWGIEEALPSTEQVTAGTTYRVTGWGKSGAATEPVTLQVRWLDDADNSLDVSTISAASLTSSSWTSLSSTVTAPAGATTAQFMVSSNSGSTGSTVYFDDLAIAPVVTTVTPVPTPTPDTTAPSTPSGLSATTSSSPSVQLAWQASTDNVGVTSYLVRRGGVTIAQLGAGTLSYTDTNVVAGASYDYTVAAVDAAGNVSADSSALNVKLPAPPDTQAPSVPTGLAATPVSSSQINLSWAASTDNVGVVGYKVYRAGAEIANVTTLSYGDSNLTAGTSYSYSVAAYDAAGNVSGQSPIIAATTAPAPVSTGSICGNVTGWLGFALAGATVKTTVAGATVSAVTNSSGVYCLSNLPYGTYKLTFGAKNYYSKNVAATLNSSSLTVNVNLIRK